MTVEVSDTEVADDGLVSSFTNAFEQGTEKERMTDVIQRLEEEVSSLEDYSSKMSKNTIISLCLTVFFILLALYVGFGSNSEGSAIDTGSSIRLLMLPAIVGLFLFAYSALRGFKTRKSIEECNDALRYAYKRLDAVDEDDGDDLLKTANL